jgi:hypothetical protein
MLAEHAFNIGLVIDYENVGAQFVPPAASLSLPARYALGMLFNGRLTSL